MLGDSYYFTQWAAVASGHPALRAIVPRVTGSQFMDMFSPGVVPKLPLYEWVLHTFTTPGMLDGAVLPPEPLAGLDSPPGGTTSSEASSTTGTGPARRRPQRTSSSA